MKVWDIVKKFNKLDYRWRYSESKDPEYLNKLLQDVEDFKNKEFNEVK